VINKPNNFWIEITSEAKNGRSQLTKVIVIVHVEIV